MSDDRLPVMKLEEAKTHWSAPLDFVSSPGLSLLSTGALRLESSTVCSKDIESLALSSCQVHDHHQPTGSELDV